MYTLTRLLLSYKGKALTSVSNPNLEFDLVLVALLNQVWIAASKIDSRTEFMNADCAYSSLDLLMH